jgi:hypothetical protein
MISFSEHFFSKHSSTCSKGNSIFFKCDNYQAYASLPKLIVFSISNKKSTEIFQDQLHMKNDLFSIIFLFIMSFQLKI